MFDHHPIEVIRPWMTIDNSGMECGTTLLAQALLAPMSPAIWMFAQNILLFDSWDFSKFKGDLPERINAGKSDRSILAKDGESGTGNSKKASTKATAEQYRYGCHDPDG